jgi:preprotein translocase subunit YajC
LDAGGLIFVIALLVLFWLFVVRPQRRRIQDMRELHESLSVGDEIVTQGGLLGFVRKVNEDDDTLLVEVAEGTNVRIARRGVAAVIPPEDGAGAGRNP